MATIASPLRLPVRTRRVRHRHDVILSTVKGEGRMMKQGVISVTVSVALVVSLVGASGPALAEGSRDRQRDGQRDGRRDGQRNGQAYGHGGVRPVVPRPFVHRPFVRRPFVSTFGGTAIVPPSVSYGSPYLYNPPVSYDPADVYGPSVGMFSTVPAQPAPSLPPVIEYPNGRYELRGDGVTTPYLWVWVPNPPPPPPVAPAPEPPAPPGPPAPPDQAPASHDLYRFTDEQGVMNWTDRWDSIPEQYRSQAKRLSL